MSGTWAVLEAREGSRLSGRMTAGLTREDAERYAAELPRVLEDFSLSFTARDLLPDLEARFQPGTPVWLGPRVHWAKGQRGTVAAGKPESFSQWQPYPGLVPWFIGTDGAEVFVTLGDGYASWWPAGWLETR